MYRYDVSVALKWFYFHMIHIIYQLYHLPGKCRHHMMYQDHCNCYNKHKNVPHSLLRDHTVYILLVGTHECPYLANTGIDRCWQSKVFAESWWNLMERRTRIVYPYLYHHTVLACRLPDGNPHHACLRQEHLQMCCQNGHLLDRM